MRWSPGTLAVTVKWTDSLGGGLLSMLPSLMIARWSIQPSEADEATRYGDFVTVRRNGMPLKAGQLAPPFTLKDTAGKSVSLSGLKGRTVVLYFYPKDDTPGCTKEACGFRDLWSEIESTGAVVLGISPDDPDSHQRFSRKFNLPFLLLSDPDHKVIEQYGAWGERRKWYGRRVEGVVRSTVLIDPDGKVRKHWPKVDDAERHPAEVLQSLKAAASRAAGDQREPTESNVTTDS